MTRNAFRQFERAQDALIRATMPRVAAADPVRHEEPVRRPRPSAVRPLTFRLGEVAHV